MTKFWLVSLALATAVATAPAAKADPFGITFSGAGVSGSGTLTGTSIGGGNFDITSGTLTLTIGSTTFNNVTVIPDTLPNNALENYGPTNADYPTGWFTYDDILTPKTSPYVDGDGGLLLEVSSTQFIELYANGSATWWDEYLVTGDSWPIGAGGDGAPVTMDITESPEPSSLLLLGTGLLCLAGFIFRKSKPTLVRAA
ncbi:MAG: PEP-CTERM sorting domain-containing protein [Terracidiphilus sp.]|jgi:hypothetical protein